MYSSFFERSSPKKRPWSDTKMWSFWLTLISFPVLVWLRAVVLHDLWDWFLKPAFGLPAINNWAALGLSLTAAFFINGLAPRCKEPDDEDNPDTRAVRQSLAKLLSVLVVWGAGCWFSHYAVFARVILTTNSGVNT